jgi:hypothetical protein
MHSHGINKPEIKPRISRRTRDTRDTYRATVSEPTQYTLDKDIVAPFDANYIWSSFRDIRKAQTKPKHGLFIEQANRDASLFSRQTPPRLIFDTYTEWKTRFPYARDLPMGWNSGQELFLRNPDTSRHITNPLSPTPSHPSNGFGGSRGSQKTRFKKRNLRKYKSIKKSKKRSFRKRGMY